MNPIKQLNDPQFLVQTCQCVSPPPHIGLFYAECNVLWKTQSNWSSIRLAGRFGWVHYEHTTPVGGAVKQKQ